MLCSHRRCGRWIPLGPWARASGPPGRHRRVWLRRPQRKSEAGSSADSVAAGLVRPGPGPTSTYRRPLPHAQLFLGAGATATSTAAVAVGLDRLDDDSEATQQATTKSQLRHAVDRSCSWFGSGRYTRGLGYVYLFDVLFRYLYLICIWITQD